MPDSQTNQTSPRSSLLEDGTSSIGILMVDSQFERLLGDIGNPATWPFAVRYEVVRGATPAEMVALESSDVLDDFIEAANRLIDAGVIGITTTCGFLGLYQQALANHCPVPVATSALLQIPMIERLLPDSRRVGILTYNAAALSDEHLRSVGAAIDTPMTGLDPDSTFYRWIMDGSRDVSIDQLRADAVDTATCLVQANPSIGAIVSECTNLTPFAVDIQRATGLPVFDMVSMMHWFRQGLVPLSYPSRAP